MKNQQKAEATPANLSVELQEVLLFIAKSGFSPEKVKSLLLDFKLIGEEEYSKDLLNCVGLILSSSEELSTDEIISTHRCFELARTLRELKQ